MKDAAHTLGKGVTEEDAENRAALSRQYRLIEQLSIDDLKRHYEGLGLPIEHDMHRDDYIHLLKQIALWQSVPKALLKRACSSAAAVRTTLEEESERDLLVDAMLEMHCIEMWESKGFQAKRIGDVGKVIKVVRDFNAHVESGSKELHGVSRFESMCFGLWTDMCWRLYHHGQKHYRPDFFCLEN